MRLHSIAVLAAVGAICLCGPSRAFGQEEPNVVWEVPNTRG